MTPRAKMETWLKAPPRKTSRRLKMPFTSPVSLVTSMPGRAMKDPKRKIRINPMVLSMRVLSSSITKMCLMEVKNLCMWFVYDGFAA